MRNGAPSPSAAPHHQFGGAHHAAGFDDDFFFSHHTFRDPNDVFREFFGGDPLADLLDGERPGAARDRGARPAV